MTKTLVLILSLLPSVLLAQTDVTVTMDPSRAASIAQVAVPFPDSIPKTPGSAPVTPEEINAPFFAPLTRDIAYSDAFAITPLPPGVPPTIEAAKRAGAHYYLRLNVFREGDEYLVDAELYETTGALVARGKRYRATRPALAMTAHTIADDVLRLVTGRKGIFKSQIAYASNRSGHWEIWLMDWDGANQRQITNHKTISILPSWAPDNERMVYTSFLGGTSNMWLVNRRGGGRIRLHTALGLNTSATFSPVSNDIAFVGSVNGNPDIYLIRDDGSNIRRLTSTQSIESTPEWSPNGRQISFTSGRSGSPQIYVMDAEGTNVRRISFDGDWNDDATWSPNGEQIAYTSRVAGRFQIRIHNTVTGRSRIIAGQGSNEQPTWSPDGKWLAFQSNRSGKWQVYRVREDGTDLLQLTFEGENREPDWSKKVE